MIFRAVRRSAPDVVCLCAKLLVFECGEVLEVEAELLRGERCSVLGMGDAANVSVREVVLYVDGSDLESVEEESGAFGIKPVVGEGLEDVDEGELDGGGVFDGWEIEAWGADCRFSMSFFSISSNRVGSVVDGFCWGEAAIREPKSVMNCLALVETGVEVAPVAAFDRGRIASSSTSADVSTLRIHWSSFLSLARTSARSKSPVTISTGTPPPSRCGSWRYNVCRIMRM